MAQKRKKKSTPKKAAATRTDRLLGLLLRALVYAAGLLALYYGYRQIEGEAEEEPPMAASDSCYAARIEVPAIEAAGNYHAYTTHYKGRETLTFSMEYDPQRRHAKWVAFTFAPDTRQRNWKRARWKETEWKGDPFQPDPTLPPDQRVEAAEYRGSAPYVRGHIVASYDRVYSKEANEQTYYLSNMSPMLASFNAGGKTLWDDMEGKMQKWGRNAKFCDTLYVVKGAPLADSTIVQRGTRALPRHPKGLTVPKFYYAAAICRKGDSYRGIAFWFEHKPNTPGKLRDYAISIDELERRCGIDLFHNLPDKVEQRVESELDLRFWGI